MSYSLYSRLNHLLPGRLHNSDQKISVSDALQQRSTATRQFSSMCVRVDMKPSPLLPFRPICYKIYAELCLGISHRYADRPYRRRLFFSSFLQHISSRLDEDEAFTLRRPIFFAYAARPLQRSVRSRRATSHRHARNYADEVAEQAARRRYRRAQRACAGVRRLLPERSSQWRAGT